MTGGAWPQSHYEATEHQVEDSFCRAVVATVAEDSPAKRAGLVVGDVVTHVEEMPLRDIIEWRWQADGFDVELALEDGRVLLLERELGEDWGVEFDDVIFDGLMTCCNTCSFCFMTMLPKGMRPTMYVRDDDYRLSFLQGNFVTLTNVDDAELERIVEYGLSPLHVSLHAVSPDVREQLIGRNHARGIEVLETLLDNGIEVHVQLVVVPGVNDGLELMRTLSWVEQRPSILSCGLVPLGYTRFQNRFESSFSDDPGAAAAVIELVREFQEDSMTESRDTRFHLADEFYLDAGFSFPPAAFYDGYPQFEDGIGMMRSFIDEWELEHDRIAALASAWGERPPATIVCGTAFARVLDPLLSSSPLDGKLKILAVENDFFGGNVDVSCLLTGVDVRSALQSEQPSGTVLIPAQALNESCAFLDDTTLEELIAETGCELRPCTYSPADILTALLNTE